MTDPRKTMTGLYIAAGIVLFLAVVFGAYKLGTRKPATPADNALRTGIEANAETSPAPKDPEFATPGETTNTAAPVDETASTEGREEAAVAAAIERKPELTYRVDGHARDWSEVNVYAGESEGNWTKVVTFRWEDGKYAYVGEKPFPPSEAKATRKPAAKKAQPRGEDQPLTEDDLKDIPKEFRPGESTALDAATSAPDDSETVEYVGKVRSHSKDWATAVVWVGPPEGEYCFEVKLKWDRKEQRYEVAGGRALETP